MKIGIIGFGNVGQACAHAFRKVGHEVLVHDIRSIKPEPNCSINELHKTVAVFVCVPTPAHVDGSADLANLQNAVSNLNYDKYKGLIVIKSTVPPLTCVSLQTHFPEMRFASNPEFLRQQTANEDMMNPDRIVIGTSNFRDFSVLSEVYRNWLQSGTSFVACTPTEAEIAKYLSNAFLVMKVAFACQIAEVCNLYKTEKMKVQTIVGADKRIGPSHLNSFQGKIPVSSPCLPKDLKALIQNLKQHGFESQFFKTILEYGVEKEK